MKKTFFIILLLLGFISSPSYSLGANISGFIPGQIWYSKDSLIEGDTVNIYTAVWNGGEGTLLTKVEFYDKKVVLGSREVSLAPSEIKSVSIPWKITAGDHTISAKIISSSLNVSGKKENIILSNIATSSDKQFVSVKTIQGDNTKEIAKNAIQDQVEKVSDSIDNIVPSNVSDKVSSSFEGLDDFRSTSYEKVKVAKDDSKKNLEEIKIKVNNPNQNTEKDKTDMGGVEKPIEYIKLFLLSVLGFILGSKIVFYVLLALIIFYVLRAIYRKIRK